MIEPAKPFRAVADLGWPMARIEFHASKVSPPVGDRLIIVSPDDTDENGYTPPACVVIATEAHILALGALIDEWKAARAAAMNPES